MTARWSLRQLFGLGFCITILLAAKLTNAQAADLDIRVGVLKFGTVNWELDTLKHKGFERPHGFRLTIVPYASPRATKVALLGGAVDIIVADWVWVSRQRASGTKFSFVPYSSSVGALMVPQGSTIDSLDKIAGARIGIAGGPLDKSWLLAQAYLRQQNKPQVSKSVKLTFGAPPLLNQLLLRGELDGVLTYWHYATRLQAAGMRRVVGVEALAKSMGVVGKVPLLGYVFREDWADQNNTTLLGFIAASRKTKQHLASEPAAWRRLRPLMRVKDDTTMKLLKQGFLDGIPAVWNDQTRAQADKLFGLLAKVGGPAFSGGQMKLEAGTFWPALTY